MHLNHRSAIRRFLSAAILILGAAPIANAADHREAPLTTLDHKVDVTDVYAFVSYEPGREGTLTFLMNVMPLGPVGTGAQLRILDPLAHYEIHIDNDGDAEPDITYRFRFRNAYTPLQQRVDSGELRDLPSVYRPVPVGGTVPGGVTELGLVEQYSLERVTPGGVTPMINVQSGGLEFTKPVDNIGDQTIPDYESYATSHIHDFVSAGTPVVSGRVFVGQRDDSHVSNLREVQENLTLPARGTRGDANALNTVVTLGLEIATSSVTGREGATIGVWCSVSLPRLRELNPDSTQPDNATVAVDPGDRVAVSRMGNPLVKEMFIPALFKNLFNFSPPSLDAAQFSPALLEPPLVGLLGGSSAGRADLVAAFLAGLPDLNPFGTGDMLRLNTGIPPRPRDQQGPFGPFAPPGEADDAGWPNGRRPGDDVNDSVLRLATGSTEASDGAIVDASFFGDSFPYLPAPNQGTDVPFCAKLLHSDAPQETFVAVADAFVETSGSGRLVAPLDPDSPIDFYLVETSDVADVVIRLGQRSVGTQLRQILFELTDAGAD